MTLPRVYASGERACVLRADDNCTAEPEMIRAGYVDGDQFVVVFFCMGHFSWLNRERVRQGLDPIEMPTERRGSISLPSWRNVAEALLVVVLMIASLAFMAFLGLKFVELTRMAPPGLY